MFITEQYNTIRLQLSAHCFRFVSHDIVWASKIKLFYFNFIIIIIIIIKQKLKAQINWKNVTKVLQRCSYWKI